jgi:hypothetical protein
MISAQRVVLRVCSLLLLLLYPGCQANVPSVLQRRVDVKRILTVTQTSANVKRMTPFSNYSIQVAAVTIRTYDCRVLIGQNSTAIYLTTLEDVPSEPRNLSYVAQPPSQVDLR